MKKIDIVVPIYNAYKYTLECINSILKYTDLNNNNLLLINDKSPDESILPMLNSFKEKNPDKNIIVLNNKENIGFVATVNIGMKFSDNDVVLLNSDTEVTLNWLEKIYRCAYSNEYIATVTPLTNNGTIASVPNFGVDNDLPDNMSLEEYAAMIEKLSKNRYPELTTGNGFCMFIKRDVIKEIGLFDDKTFGKGYGEENDFCYRALDYGYINVLCDNTFVYHKGTQSFKKENLTSTRATLINEHMQILRNRYPLYVQKTDNFIGNNPLIDIQENIHLNILLYKKKRILYIINEWKEDMDMTGGTSLHLKDIISANNKNNIASFVFSPDNKDLSRFKLYLYTDEYSREIATYKTDINDYGQIKYTNNIYKEILENIIESFKINILHVHHFLFHTFDVIDIAKKKNIYSIITLHDLYMICPSINMIYKDIYCKFDKEKDCLKCLKMRYGVNNDILSTWQDTCYLVLKKFDKIIVPSNNTKEVFNNTYSNLDIEVVEHGVNLGNIPTNKLVHKNTDKIFNIAFVGAMAIHKGSNILKDLISLNTSNSIKIHLFGKTFDESLNKKRKNFVNHGPYKRGELPKLLINNNIDLVCIFSTWPETYSYTLTEVYMAKVPVLTFNIGAIGERIKNDELGWVIDFTKDTNKILKKVNQIKNNKSDYNKVKQNFEKYTFLSLEDMQECYEKLYNNVSDDNYKLDVKRFIDYKKNNYEYEYKTYMKQYSHVVNRYERMRKTGIWKLFKRGKRVVKIILRRKG